MCREHKASSSCLPRRLPPRSSARPIPASTSQRPCSSNDPSLTAHPSASGFPSCITRNTSIPPIPARRTQYTTSFRHHDSTLAHGTTSIASHSACQGCCAGRTSKAELRILKAFLVCLSATYDTPRLVLAVAWPAGSLRVSAKTRCCSWCSSALRCCSQPHSSSFLHLPSFSSHRRVWRVGLTDLREGLVLEADLRLAPHLLLAVLALLRHGQRLFVELDGAVVLFLVAEHSGSDSRNARPSRDRRRHLEPEQNRRMPELIRMHQRQPSL